MRILNDHGGCNLGPPRVRLMGEAGVIVLGVGVWFCVMGFAGRGVARRYPNLFDDSVFVGLKPLQRFQVLRQRSIVRQGPIWIRIGEVAVACGVLAILLDIAIRFA